MKHLHNMPGPFEWWPREQWSVADAAKWPDATQYARFLAQLRVAEGIDVDNGKRSTGGIGQVICTMLARWRRVNKGQKDLEGDLFACRASCMPSDGIITI